MDYLKITLNAFYNLKIETVQLQSPLTTTLAYEAHVKGDREWLASD